jgi:hypothetical protein
MGEARSANPGADDITLGGEVSGERVELVGGEELWEVFRGLLPVRPPQRTGRPRVDDRVAFNAVMRADHRDRLAAPASGDGLLAGDCAPPAAGVAAPGIVAAIASGAAS